MVSKGYFKSSMVILAIHIWLFFNARNSISFIAFFMALLILSIEGKQDKNFTPFLLRASAILLILVIEKSIFPSSQSFKCCSKIYSSRLS